MQFFNQKDGKTERTGVAEWSYIRYVLGSNLGQNTGNPDSGFHGFPSYSGQFPV
jgi:hypothetical protein